MTILNDSMPLQSLAWVVLERAGENSSQNNHKKFIQKTKGSNTFPRNTVQQEIQVQW